MMMNIIWTLINQVELWSLQSITELESLLQDHQKPNLCRQNPIKVLNKLIVALHAEARGTNIV